MQESCNLEYVRVYTAIRFRQIKAVPYPVIFWGCRFFGKRSEEKNRCAAGESWPGGGIGGWRCKLFPVGSRSEAPENIGYFAF